MIIRVVFFTTDKRNQFQNYQKQKSPLKITNFTVSKKFGSENILIRKKTSVEWIDKLDDFEPTILESNSVLSIAQLNNISSNQIISVTATPKRISGIKKLHLDGEVVHKHELTVADPTRGIKVLLWGNACKTEILIDKT